MRGFFTAFFVPLLLTVQFIPDTESVVIQAILDLDNDSEDLIGDLINKVDSLIDPKVMDSANATQELAYALLRIGPLISITGNITNSKHAISLSFSFNARAGMQGIASETDDDKEGGEEEVGGLGMLGTAVWAAELWVVSVISLVFNNVVSLMVTNIMGETALLSGTSHLD
ncbi:hypothetical protein GE061_015658 [Apolygus lucorum]|uniref:Uncharacterized protein n=1 Tax=Apolygus lucorum TaxID=248454 RepID=A0A6A4K6L8_APOLU|nr:hypothetical protein GE061_015658 [Apolygus lucorum]